jgi:hypothetical protein
MTENKSPEEFRRSKGLSDVFGMQEELLRLKERMSKLQNVVKKPVDDLKQVKIDKVEECIT